MTKWMPSCVCHATRRGIPRTGSNKIHHTFYSHFEYPTLDESPDSLIRPFDSLRAASIHILLQLLLLALKSR